MMDGTTMGDQIVAAIQAANPRIQPSDVAFLKTFWEPIATAIVTHIQNNAVVTVTGVSTGSQSAEGTVD